MYVYVHIYTPVAGCLSVLVSVFFWNYFVSWFFCGFARGVTYVLVIL